MSYTFLTGGTGLLGRYLIKDLITAEIPLAVLVRATRRAGARDRVENMMLYWESELGRKLPRPVVLEGDITETDLGLDPRSMRWVAENCDSLLHNAASLTFESTSSTSEPWRSNVVGTQNVLDLCRNARIRMFHHVSTAYVCGLRQGRILESELDVGQRMSNDYEQSKVQAEKMIRAADFLDQVTVYRPAIIIGDSRSGYTTTYHGYYVPLQAVYTMARTQEPNATGWIGTSARFALSGHETKNLVPVDWVSAVIAHIVRNPEHHGQTYHLTPRHPITARLLADALEEAAGFYGVRLEGGGRQLSGLTEHEALFCELIRVYSSYWKDDPTFDARNTQRAAPHLPCPHVDRAMLTTMADYAKRVYFTAPRARPIEPLFDVVRALEPYLDATIPEAAAGRTERVGLRVTGRGGGDWTLTLNEHGLLAAEIGVNSSLAALVSCDSDVLADIVAGASSPEAALGDRVRLQGPVSAPTAARALRAVCLADPRPAVAAAP
ncbi:MAG: SDR family oxidoreductase [Planctomycetaceae bacterium]